MATTRSRAKANERIGSLLPDGQRTSIRKKPERRAGGNF
jgi:hypothetical protein